MYFENHFYQERAGAGAGAVSATVAAAAAATAAAKQVRESPRERHALYGLAPVSVCILQIRTLHDPCRSGARALCP
jgi:hypothetical protein